MGPVTLLASGTGLPPSQRGPAQARCPSCPLCHAVAAPRRPPTPRGARDPRQLGHPTVRSRKRRLFLADTWACRGSRGPVVPGWQGRSSGPARLGWRGLGRLGPPAAPSTSPGAGTAQQRCPQCLEQRSLLAGCAMAAGARSPSQPCPLLPEAAPWEGPGSTSPPPLTLPCPTSSWCCVLLCQHLAPSRGQALGDPPRHAELWVPGGGCPAHKRVHLLGLQRAAVGVQGTFAPRWRWATRRVPVSWLCGC